MLDRLMLVALMLGHLSSLLATTIYDNGPSNQLDGSNISAYVSADDFTIGVSGATLNRVGFESSADFDPYQSQFVGSIGWGIFAGTANGPGDLLFSGIDSSPTLSDTGLQIAGTEEWRVEFVLPAIAVSAGTYWLAIHEGALGGSDDGTELYWDTTANQTNNTGMATADLTGLGGWNSNGLDSGVGADLAFDISGSNGADPEPSFFLFFLISMCAVYIRKLSGNSSKGFRVP